jgi:asparagine synthetase B (glutamine-hydrolysing)
MMIDLSEFHLLSEEVSQHVTVVQCGQGAYEVFAGYDWYPPLEDARVWLEAGCLTRHLEMTPSPCCAAPPRSR